MKRNICLRVAVALSVLSMLPISAQEPVAEKPLPDIPTLMRQVEANERAAEAIEKDYIYRVARHFDKLDSHQDVKESRDREVEIFWINGVEVARTLSRNGKPLTPDEQGERAHRLRGEEGERAPRQGRCPGQGDRLARQR
jgi:hypothetical protein